MFSRINRLSVPTSHTSVRCFSSKYTDDSKKNLSVINSSPVVLQSRHITEAERIPKTYKEVTISTSYRHDNSLSRMKAIPTPALPSHLQQTPVQKLSGKVYNLFLISFFCVTLLIILFAIYPDKESEDEQTYVLRRLFAIGSKLLETSEKIKKVEVPFGHQSLTVYYSGPTNAKTFIVFTTGNIESASKYGILHEYLASGIRDPLEGSDSSKSSLLDDVCIITYEIDQKSKVNAGPNEIYTPTPPVTIVSAVDLAISTVQSQPLSSEDKKRKENSKEPVRSIIIASGRDAMNSLMLLARDVQWGESASSTSAPLSSKESKQSVIDSLIEIPEVEERPIKKSRHHTVSGLVLLNPQLSLDSEESVWQSAFQLAPLKPLETWVRPIEALKEPPNPPNADSLIRQRMNGLTDGSVKSKRLPFADDKLTLLERTRGEVAKAWRKLISSKSVFQQRDKEIYEDLLRHLPTAAHTSIEVVALDFDVLPLFVRSTDKIENALRWESAFAFLFEGMNRENMKRVADFDFLAYLKSLGGEEILENIKIQETEAKRRKEEILRDIKEKEIEEEQRKNEKIAKGKDMKSPKDKKSELIKEKNARRQLSLPVYQFEEFAKKMYQLESSAKSSVKEEKEALEKALSLEKMKRSMEEKNKNIYIPPRILYPFAYNKDTLVSEYRFPFFSLFFNMRDEGGYKDVISLARLPDYLGISNLSVNRVHNSSELIELALKYAPKQLGVTYLHANPTSRRTSVVHPLLPFYSGDSSIPRTPVLDDIGLQYGTLIDFDKDSFDIHLTNRRKLGIVIPELQAPEVIAHSIVRSLKKIGVGQHQNTDIIPSFDRVSLKPRELK